jgi:SDR family mycofactocin-dependent oxidoreductase
VSRVAIVTGAARGIGAATVAQLAAEGWGVVAVDACADNPAVGYPLGTREELYALADHGAVTPVVADVRNQDALVAAVRIAEDEYGPLDAAVAAAAVMAGGEPLWEIADTAWDALFEVGVRGVLHLARAAVPRLLARAAPRSGRFVAVASAAAHRGLWRLAGYTAAKHAVLGLVRGLAADLRGTGVSATAVSPGSTDTAMLAATLGQYGLTDPRELAGDQDHLLAPAEVAAAICWLCGPQSSALTGSVLHTDSGFTG